MKSSPFISLAPRFEIERVCATLFMKASNYTTSGKVESRFWCVHIGNFLFEDFWGGWSEGNEQLIISIKLTHTLGLIFGIKHFL